jgi:TATA-binding protein-associated factor
VSALDRFGDFTADALVAPVREAVAQVVGVLARVLRASHLSGVTALLLELCRNATWDVRQGGLLSLRCVLAVAGDRVMDMSQILEAVVGRLGEVSEVHTVAATGSVGRGESVVVWLDNT